MADDSVAAADSHLLTGKKLAVAFAAMLLSLLRTLACWGPTRPRPTDFF